MVVEASQSTLFLSLLFGSRLDLGVIFLGLPQAERSHEKAPSSVQRGPIACVEKADSHTIGPGSVDSVAIVEKLADGQRRKGVDGGQGGVLFLAVE